MPGVETLREPLAAIIRAAGDLARETAKGPYKRWTKGDDDSPVSEADIAVDNFLRPRLRELLPGAGWLSEETEREAPQHENAPTWIVDPIDGTRAFLQGRADWTIAVALAENGRPTLAALYAPVTDELFMAAAGQGTTLNGARLKTSTGANLSGARLAGPQRYLKRLSDLDASIAPQPKVFSLALRIARVAEGALDAAFASSGSHDWDLAAADLLVHEAGGTMTDFNGHLLRYNRPHDAHGALLAAGTARHEALVGLVRNRQSEFA